MPSTKMDAKKSPAPPEDDLRRTFATALAQMQQSERPLSRSQTPIFVRMQDITPNGPEAEKRALTTAARALAQLWNISPTLIR